MDVYVKDNTVCLRNIDRAPEDKIFEKIVKAFRSDKRVNTIKTIMGPSEDIVTANCVDEEVILAYDIDYGLDPIQCTENNVNIVFDIVSKVVNSE